MKGHKGGGVKPSQGKGELASVDREPLFPRLHVSETEKAGPKAPPRNKMALYEQFTVPSHGFIQPTQVATFHQPYGSGYPFMPHYVPSAAYANSSNVQYSQPSQVTSSSGFTSGSMVVSMEAHRAPRQNKVGSLQVLTEATTECITSDVPPQREKSGSSLNDNVESVNSHGNIATGKFRPPTLEKTESLHEVMSSLKESMEGMHERCDGPSVAADVNGGRSKRLSGGVSAPCDLSERLTKPTQKGVAAKMQAGKSGHNCDSINQSLSGNEHCHMQNGTSFEMKNSEESRAFLAADDQNLLPDNQGPSFTLGSDKYSQVQPCCNTLQTFLPKVNKVEGSKGEMENLGIKSFEEHKTKNKEHHESQPGCCGVSPDNSADFMPVIKPKDVILAVGQQQFWKARKTLLRQQRIFSDQVFQLHKLIMIQQLLAETPGTLIDESVHFETVGECEAPAPQTKRSFNPSTYARNAGDSKKKSKSQPVDVESSPAVSKDVKEVKISTPELVCDEISAWGYPSFGQWIGPMAAQGQLYGYQQLAEGLPPGSAFSLPYVSSGPAPPMVSFGIPYCGRQQELPAEISSNYGPATVSKQDGSGLLSRNFGHFSNDFASSWYIMQHNNLNNQRMHSGASGKAVSTGSGTSVNKAPVTAARGVKTSCFPGLAYHWGISNQAAGPSNTEGLESSGHQSEISSPSMATRLATSLTPSAPAAKKLVLSHKKIQGSLGKNLEMLSVHRSHSSDSKRYVENKEDLDASPSSKVQDKGGISPVDDGLVDASVHLSDVGCALELFPLVPSLGSNGWNRERDGKAVEGGQGHVIRAVPRRAIAASESAAGILLSLQKEKQK
ncbi:hypothetical protein L7F22_016070 [Adiantum nelumboides]|nr:hypothetical protein [Adiantum nelumboides]